MNDGRRKIRIFFTTLIIGFGGVLPAAGCTGGCGSCFQCAGLGGIAAIFTALGIVRRSKPAVDHGRQQESE